MSSSQTTVAEQEFESRAGHAHVHRISVAENSTSCSGSPHLLVSSVSYLHVQSQCGPISTIMLTATTTMFHSARRGFLQAYTAQENRLTIVSGSLESGYDCGGLDGTFYFDGRRYGLVYLDYAYSGPAGIDISWRFGSRMDGFHPNYHCRVKNEEGCTLWDDQTFIEICVSRESCVRRRHETNARGCTQVCGWDHELCPHVVDHLLRVFRWLWMIQWLGNGYMVWMQLVFYLGCRLCLLHFKRGAQYAGEEFCWHIFRGIFWSLMTFSGLLICKNVQRKRMVKVQQRRFAFPVRPGPRIRHKGWLFSCLLLSSHVSALPQAPEQQYSSSVDPTSGVHDFEALHARSNGSFDLPVKHGYAHWFRWDKGGTLPTCEISWTRPVTDISQDQRNGTTLVREPLNNRWLRVDSTHTLAMASEVTRIALYGHVFKDDALGARYKDVQSFSPPALQTYVREFWPEFCSLTHCQTFLIEEQPPSQDRRPTVHFIVELEQRPPLYRYYLADVFDEFNMLQRTTVAVHQSTAITDVIDAVFAWTNCQPNGFRLCVMEHLGIEYRRQSEFVPPHASYVKIHRLGIARSFHFHPNLLGLHHLAQSAYSSSGDAFTAEPFRIQHDIFDGQRTTVCSTEFQGQDLLTPVTFLQSLHCIALDHFVGTVQVDSQWNPSDGFRISWNGFRFDPGDHVNDENDVIHLQQTGMKAFVRPPGIPDLHFRYDPDKFDQEHDTVIDQATYPLPQDANDELDLPPRHRWRNLGDIWPQIETVHSEHIDTFRLDTYGLRDRYLSNRIVEVHVFEPGAILRAIASTWAEYALGEHMNVYLVTPQPPNTPPAMVALIIEFPTVNWDMMISRAVLIDSFVDNTPTKRQAEYVDNLGPARSVALATGYRPRCRPTGIDLCLISDRGTVLQLHEDMQSHHGDYKILLVESFERLNAQVLWNFPSARAHVSDFQWRSNHFDQNLFTLFIYPAAGETRVAPTHIERDTTNFMEVNYVWQHVLEAVQPYGASQRSILHQVWPQTIYHAEQHAIHLVLDVYPNFPMVPVLITIVVQAGGLRAQRIETRAFQLPPRISIIHLLGLVGYSSFSQEFALSATVAYAGSRYQGDDYVMDLVAGGNYEVRFQILSLTSFIPAVAEYAQRRETVSAESSTSDSQEQEPDLRFYPSDGTTALSRTWEGVSGTHFVILDARERSARDFVAGIIELVITADEDESSMAFCAVLPISLTWWHVWSWLRLGTGFAENSQYRFVLDGTTITDPMARISPRTGFFAQITMVTVPPATYVGISTMRARSLRGDLCFGLPSGVGTVYRGGFYAQDSSVARLPYEERDAAITRRWTDLTVWSSSRVHPTGRGRHPPWHRIDPVLVHPHPDGLRVVVLVTLFEGSGGDDYALILHRHSSVLTLYQALGCYFRCISPDYTCVTTVNLMTPPSPLSLNLEDGDYLEVFVLHRRVHPGVLTLLVGNDEVAPLPAMNSSEPTATTTRVGTPILRASALSEPCVGKLTEVGIHTEDNLDLRSDAASEDARMIPHFCRTWPIDNLDTAVVLLQLKVTLQWPTTRISTTTLPMNYAVIGHHNHGGYTPDFIYQTFSDLPPPGNGTLVDLRRDLDALDDITIHEWGECCFDFREQYTAKITSVSMSLPQLRNISDYLCGAALPNMPATFLYDFASELPEVCQAEVASLSPEPPDNPVYRRIYTDGSYDSHATPTIRVGWGFAVFLCGVDSIYLEHMACGYIEDDHCPMAHGFPVQLNARTGEIEALIQASLWLLAAGSAIPVETHYDAITVGHSGYGHWNFNPQDKHIRVLRCLSQVLSTLPYPPSGHHVKAHEGVFGNEVANLLAQQARILPAAFGRVDVDLSHFTQGERMPLEYVWLDCVRHQDDVSAWPDVLEDTLCCPMTETLPTVASSLPRTLWDTTTATTKIRSIELGFATYNVCTLGDSGETRDRLQAHEYLRAQVIAHGLNVLFLQETRAKKDAVIESGTHVRLIAGANNGHGGTEIWISKRTQGGRTTGA